VDDQQPIGVFRRRPRAPAACCLHQQCQPASTAAATATLTVSTPLDQSLLFAAATAAATVFAAAPRPAFAAATTATVEWWYSRVADGIFPEFYDIKTAAASIEI